MRYFFGKIHKISGENLGEKKIHFIDFIKN